MSAEKLDYAAIIADLEAKKNLLETAIASVHAAMVGGALGQSDTGGAGIVATTAVPFAASGSEVPDGAFHGKTVPAAMKLYLGIVNKKQTTREISDGLKKGGLESTSKYFDKIIYSTLDRLRRTGEILKIGNCWGLPEWYSPAVRAGLSQAGNGVQRYPRYRGGKSRGRPRKTQDGLRAVQPEAGKQAPPAAGDEAHATGPQSRIESFLRENPNQHTVADITKTLLIPKEKTTQLLLGKLVKTGTVERMENGNYRFRATKAV